MQLTTIATSPANTTSATPVAQHRPEDRTGIAARQSQSREGVDQLAAYYAPAQGKSGADLLRALHLIIRTGHVDRGYAQARDEMFGEVDDLDGDNKVEDLFTGDLRGPITGRKDAFDHGFNTEHTWPQSKGATGIAQSDLHHLRPSDIRTNERRGSHPYGDVVDASWTTGSGVDQAKLGVDEIGRTVFEPRQSIKGDVARGLLYFFTRYDQSRPGRFTLENFKTELPTLLKWHAQDPVTDAERLRNQAVFEVQGNRNPFVDRPELVDQVDFPKLKFGR